jgi:hypothetical protein
MKCIYVLGLSITLASAAFAADSVVVGRALSDSYAASLPCPKDEICLDALYRWVIDSERTIAGPKVRGRIAAQRSQHADVTDSYLQSLRLFVLRPISEVEAPHSAGVKYYLVSSSPIYEDGKYCISVDPSISGLKLQHVTVGNDGSYCFDRKLLQ